MDGQVLTILGILGLVAFMCLVIWLLGIDDRLGDMSDRISEIAARASSCIPAALIEVVSIL